MKAFEFNNTTIYYRVSGQGDPVLFLHGFLEDHSMWNTVAAELEASGFQVILIDLPCHGRSRFKGNTCSMTLMAEILHALCKFEKINHPKVFGHSMGGYVGLELLKLRPIDLTLVHSNFWDDPPSKKKDRDRVVTIVQENKMRLINEAIPNLFAPENRTSCENAISSLIEHAKKIPSNEIVASTRGMRDRLNNVELMEDHPITIIQGEMDGIVKTEKLNQALKELNRKPELYLIKNCGHMSIWESPETLINYVKVIVFK